MCRQQVERKRNLIEDVVARAHTERIPKSQVDVLAIAPVAIPLWRGVVLI